MEYKVTKQHWGDRQYFEGDTREVKNDNDAKELVRMGMIKDPKEAEAKAKADKETAETEKKAAADAEKETKAAPKPKNKAEKAPENKSE